MNNQQLITFYEKFIMIYEKNIYAFIFSWVKNHSDTLDICQSVMEKAWVNLTKLRDPYKAKRWLFQIAYREILQFFRKQSRENKWRATEDTWCMDNLVDDNKEILEYLILQYEKGLAVKALDMLDPEEQSILSLRYFEGFSTQQIADILGLKPATLRSKLSRCLKKYKILFENLDKGEDGSVK